MVRSLFWRIWWRSISVKRPQAALAAVSLLVGAAVTSMLLNLYGDVRRKMTQEFNSYGANVILAPATRPPSIGAESASLMDQSVVDALKRYEQQRPGLIAVPVLYSVVHIGRVAANSRFPDFENVIAVGTDLAALQRLNSGWRIKGQPGQGTQAGTCALGAHLAAHQKLQPGDSVKLEALGDTSDSGPLKNQTYRVAEIVSSGSSEDDQVFLPLNELQSLAGLTGKLSLVELNLPGDTADVERGIRELAAAMPAVEVRPIRQIVYTEGKVLDTIRWLLLSLTGLILVIIAICVIATMTAIVLERRKDVGVMKALGAGDLEVIRFFVAEGAGLGLVSGLAGFLAGVLMARWVGERLFGVALGLAWWTMPAVCGLTMFLAVVATWFPVRIVRGIRPALVLKGE